MRPSASWPGAALGLLIIGCGPTFPQLHERDLYLCCNLFFTQRRLATDANYSAGRDDYRELNPTPQDRVTLPVGTRVRLIADRGSRVVFSPVGSESRYTLGFRYAGEGWEASDYFGRIFLSDDPRPGLIRTSPTVLEAIRRGDIIVGMTKPEVLASRGYPPFHKTPGIQADEWIYFRNPVVQDRVSFENGMVSAVIWDSKPRPE